MIRFACPKCRKVYKAELAQAGRQTVCKQCDAIVVIPEQPIREVHYGVALPPNGVVEAAEEPVPATQPVPPPSLPKSDPLQSPLGDPSPKSGGRDSRSSSFPPPRERQWRDEEEEPIRWRRPPQKFCHACGESINKRTSICPDCGVRQFDPDDEEDADDDRRAARRRDDAIHSTRVTAAVLGILLGGFGVHKFVLGYTEAGVAMLLTSLLSVPAGILLGAFTCGAGLILLFGAAVMSVIGLIEGVLYLTKSDREFRRVYIQRRKAWF